MPKLNGRIRLTCYKRLSLSCLSTFYLLRVPPRALNIPKLHGLRGFLVIERRAERRVTVGVRVKMKWAEIPP